MSKPICKWIKANTNQCTLKAISNKNYCKLHKKFEELFLPEELSNLQRCSRCNKPVKNLKEGITKCKECLERQIKNKKKQANKRNKNKKKCSWINHKGEPCPWKTNINVNYCKRHSVYQGIFEPSDIPLLKKCSGCNNLFKPLTDEKTCSKCHTRSEQKREKNKLNIKYCKGILKSGKQCSYKAFDNDDYCKNHQRYKKHKLLTEQGKRICSDWVRGCFNELTIYDIAKCSSCKNSTNNTKTTTSLTIYDSKYTLYKSEAKRRNIDNNNTFF